METPPSLNGSSYQKKLYSSQARPSFRASPEGVDGAERIEHQVHLAADTLADCLNQGNVIPDVRGLPAVNLEGGVAHFKAHLGEVGVGFRVFKPPGSESPT